MCRKITFYVWRESWITILESYLWLPRPPSITWSSSCTNVHAIVSKWFQEGGTHQVSTKTSSQVAGVSDKLVKNVMGHKSSKALEVHQHPTMQLEMAVSKYLHLVNNTHPSWRHSFRLCSLLMWCKLCPAQRKSYYLNMVWAVFSGMTNCTVNFTPQNVVINIQLQPKRHEFVEKHFDYWVVASYVFALTPILAAMVSSSYIMLSIVHPPCAWEKDLWLVKDCLKLPSHKTIYI